MTRDRPHNFRNFNVKCLAKKAVFLLVLIIILMVVCCGLTPALKVASDAASGWVKGKRKAAGPDLQLHLGKLIKHTFVLSKKAFVIFSSFFDKIDIMYQRAVDCLPSGGINSIYDTVSPVYSTSNNFLNIFCQYVEFLQICEMPSKGEEMLKDDRIMKRETEGKTVFLCNVEAKCIMESDSLSGITRHITVSHKKVLKTDPKKRPLADMSSTPVPGNPGKERKMEDSSVSGGNDSNESADKTTISEINRVASTLEETVNWNGTDCLETPDRPFSQVSQIVNSTQIGQRNLNDMSMDIGDDTYVPEVPSPDRGLRYIPNDLDRLRLFEATKFFNGEGSFNILTQGIVEEPSPLETEADLRKNHPYLYVEENVDGNKDVMFCSMCSGEEPIHANYGAHLLENHLDMITYMPGLWKDNFGPTCRTAVIDGNTSKRDLYYMVMELRENVDQYEKYFLEAEDCLKGRKTAVSEMDKKISKLQVSLENLKVETEEGAGMKQIDEKAALNAAIQDKEFRIRELENEKISSQAAISKERKQHLSQLQKAAASKRESKAEASKIALNAEKSLKEAEAMKSEYNALKSQLSAAEYKLQSYGMKLTQLDVQVRHITDEKNSSLQLYEEAKQTISKLLEDKDSSATMTAQVASPVTPQFVQNSEGLFIFPRNNEMDGGNTTATKANSKSGTPKNAKERCMYNDRKNGCSKENCEYSHPDSICDDYLNKKCEKPRFTCVAGHHNKTKRDGILNNKKKSEKKSEKKTDKKKSKNSNSNASQPIPKTEDNSQDTVAVGICPNWTMGACINGLQGQLRCRAGAHVPHLQGTAYQNNRQQEFLMNGPGVRAAPPAPSFFPAQQPGIHRY